ncbi:butyrophilin-like protein 2 [Sebastes umbrosus]|uniref:butyrophilin-like protein 2 n=1 Tax=Sebastes umbrosus TaxID=72105 RepID=UPI00189D97D5|nr:butyrophilin-like protein 2 [Sebastes umbrosus]
MIHMKDRLLLNPQLSDFSELVLHHIVVLLLLTHSCGGQSQVIGTSQPVVAMVGDDIILPCHLDTGVDATDRTVEWARSDLDPRFVYLRRDSVELHLEEHPLYMGRTSLFTNNLKCGDISLKLSKVKLSDAGSYRCLVPKSIDVVVELTVGSVSSPDIDISKVSNGVLLECKSKGWYPEPEVLWLDGEGNLLSAGPPETVRGPDDLYTVSSRVTVEKRHSNSFTCRVQQKNTNQTRETHVHLPADLFMVQSIPAVRITIILAVCIVPIVVFIVWKLRLNKTKTTNSSIEGDREKLMTKSQKITYLDDTKAKLDEDLKRNEGELQHVLQVIITLGNQKKDLKNQRKKLISLQQKDKTQEEENKKKLEKENTPAFDKENKMKKRSVSSPDIDISKVSNEVLLECKSKGWYPEPEVLWLDGEGNLLSAGPPETVRGPDDLYTVSSRVTVEKRHSNSFTCRVQQKNTNQTRETHIHLPADLFMVQSIPAVRITIILAVCIVPIVVFIVWKLRLNKTKTTDSSIERQPPNEGEGDREKLMTKSQKITYLDDTKAKLDEDLKRNEGELQHVQQVITTLMNQKKDLKNQREKLISLQQKDKTQEEENKKKKTPATQEKKKKE